jgi:hypothetical protein
MIGAEQTIIIGQIAIGANRQRVPRQHTRRFIPFEPIVINIQFVIQAVQWMALSSVGASDK